VGGLLLVTPPGPDADALSAQLRDRGFEVHQAGNGASAVDLAFRRQPDAILMDPSLSAMDRWHAVKRLNTEPSTSRIPVLTLVSDATSPGGLQRVMAKIERTLGGLPPTRPPTRPPSAPASTPNPPPTAMGGTQAGRRGGTPPPPLAAVDAEPPPRHRTPATTPSGTSPVGRRTPLPIGVVAVSPPAPMTSPPPVREPSATSTGNTVTPVSPYRQKVPRQASVLVVDDNAMNRDMLSRRLERKGYAVGIAEGGEQALEILQKRRYDVVLLDWMMPGLSGIDVLKRIREQWSTIELPVIMATAKSEADDIVEALRAEANDYVTKPLNFDVVHARIRTQLNLVDAHRDLMASERRYRALLENTGDLIVQFAPNGQILYVSPASRTLLGYEPEFLATRSFFDWMHPIDRRAFEEHQSRQSALPPAFTFIARMQRQDQSYIWVEVSCRVLREEGGATILHAACRDVTEHMDRLEGDEPPLPLGGDIMAHPGWRQQASKPPAPDRDHEPSGPAERQAPIVVTVVVGDPSVSPMEIGRRVAEELGRLTPRPQQES
jgi:PAS domain S-box-containing protein